MYIFGGLRIQTRVGVKKAASVKMGLPLLLMITLLASSSLLAKNGLQQICRPVIVFSEKVKTFFF